MKCRIFVVAIIAMLSGAVAGAQTLHVDSTRFITGINPSTNIQFAIPTADKGILFVGAATQYAGGIIPATPYAGNNMMIGKIDSQQQISWIKIYGGNGDDGGKAVCQTPDGGYAVIGATSSNDGDVTGFRGAIDLWVVKVDASGNLLWEHTYGSTQSEGALSIANTMDNGLILFGVTNGSDGDVPFHYGGFFSNDWLVIKTDSAGTVQWSKDLGGAGDEGGGSLLAVDSIYYIVSGSNSTDHDCTDTMWHAHVNTGGDYYVLKLDRLGNVLWDKSYGGSGDEGPNYAMFDVRDSTIVTIGLTNSNDYMVTGTHVCDGADDMWVIKVNKDGTLQWQKTLGNVHEEAGTSICASLSAGYLAYGNTHSSSCVDTNDHYIGNYDCWLFLLDNDGIEIGNKLLGGTNIDDPASVVRYGDGYVATGFSASTFFSDGTTYGNFDGVGGAFITYLDSSVLAVTNISTCAPELAMRPNPVNQILTILPPLAGVVSICNIVGVLKYQGNVSAHAINVDVREWEAGVYLVKWQGEDRQVCIQRILKM